MSVAIDRATSRNIMLRASQMVNAANSAQRQASSAIHSDEEFSTSSAQTLANEENFE